MGDLLTRPLDEISPDDLDEMLKRYSSVIDDATREALTQVLADLKQSVYDLQIELASLMANFGEQADAVSDFLTGDARLDGFSPDDPSNYGLGPNDVPWVDVPDISSVPGAFDAANDPYAAYADGVIASLQENVSGTKVIGRANFVAEVRAWRSNQKALEKAILARMSVSQAETSAFLNAQNKVTGYLQKFMNASGWFHDAPIPEDVRADVDGPLKNLYGALAEDLKDRLNEWEASMAHEVSNPFFDTVRAFASGMEVAGEIAEQYRDTMKTIVHGASRIGIGFVPFVGPALDLCEAVTGKEWCLPSGKTLTTGERVWSGLGFGIGKVVKVWSGVKTAAISAEGKAVAAGIVTLSDDLVQLLKNKFVRKWRGGIANGGLEWTGHGDVGNLYDFANHYERDALVKMLKDQEHEVIGISEDVIRKLVGIPEPSSMAGVSVACEFITISKDMLVLSEVKGIKGGVVDVEHAVLQLKNVVKALNKKNGTDGKTLAYGVERVQIFLQKEAKNLDATKFKGDYMPEGLQLVHKKTGEPVRLTKQGRDDLIVQVVYQ